MDPQPETKIMKDNYLMLSWKSLGAEIKSYESRYESEQKKNVETVRKYSPVRATVDIWYGKHI